MNLSPVFRRIYLFFQKRNSSNKYLFILSPPFSGSTLLMRILETSGNVSSFGKEGQFLPSVRRMMIGDRWNVEKTINWHRVRRRWRRRWDFRKPILLEKSPPNILRMGQIAHYFTPCYFIAMIRNPYAFCDSIVRRVRQKKTLSEAANFWVWTAIIQKRNIGTTQNVMLIKYEDLVKQTTAAKDLITDFIPELSDIDIDRYYQTRTMSGQGLHAITDLNKIKIDSLDSPGIEEINKVLLKNRQILDYFGYTLIES